MRILEAIANTDDTGRWRRLAEATAYMLAIHADQIRKGSGTPYIAHLLQVAGLVLEFGGDEDLAIAGLLHDAIEDVGIDQETVIAERFGPRVARVVRGCTDADTMPKPPWQARKEAYIAHLEHADIDVLIVSCADKLHNVRTIITDLRTIGPAVFDHFKGRRAGSVWYYATLSDVFARQLPGQLSEEFTLATLEMRRLAGMAI